MGCLKGPQPLISSCMTQPPPSESKAHRGPALGAGRGCWQKAKQQEVRWVPSPQRGMWCPECAMLISHELALCLGLDCELPEMVHRRDEEQRCLARTELAENQGDTQKAATATLGGGISGCPRPRTKDQSPFASGRLPQTKSV